MGTDWVKTHLTDAPYVIVVFEQVYGPGKRKHYYVRESVGIAVGFLLAALQESGLCALTHTPSPMGFLREVLDRPENERPFRPDPGRLSGRGSRRAGSRAQAARRDRRVRLADVAADGAAARPQRDEPHRVRRVGRLDHHPVPRDDRDVRRRRGERDDDRVARLRALGAARAAAAGYRAARRPPLRRLSRTRRSPRARDPARRRPPPGSRRDQGERNSYSAGRAPRGESPWARALRQRAEIWSAAEADCDPDQLAEGRRCLRFPGP